MNAFLFELIKLFFIAKFVYNNFKNEKNKPFTFVNALHNIFSGLVYSADV
jgi:hypothetical protein